MQCPQKAPLSSAAQQRAQAQALPLDLPRGQVQVAAAPELVRSPRRFQRISRETYAQHSPPKAHSTRRGGIDRPGSPGSRSLRRPPAFPGPGPRPTSKVARQPGPSDRAAERRPGDRRSASQWRDRAGFAPASPTPIVLVLSCRERASQTLGKSARPSGGFNGHHTGTRPGKPSLACLEACCGALLPGTGLASSTATGRLWGRLPGFQPELGRIPGSPTASSADRGARAWVSAPATRRRLEGPTLRPVANSNRFARPRTGGADSGALGSLPGSQLRPATRGSQRRTIRRTAGAGKLSSPLCNPSAPY